MTREVTVCLTSSTVCETVLFCWNVSKSNFDVVRFMPIGSRRNALSWHGPYNLHARAAVFDFVGRSAQKARAAAVCIIDAELRRCGPPKAAARV